MSKDDMIKGLQSLKNRIEQHYQDLWQYEEILDKAIDVLEYPSCDECPFGDMTGL